MSARTAIAAAGAALYLTSFFLPAVHQERDMPGWQCAWLALAAPFGEVIGIMAVVLLGAGLVNPMLIFHFVLRASGAQAALCRWTAWTVLGLIPLSWIFIAAMGLVVRIGHVLWVAGLVMMLLPYIL